MNYQLVKQVRENNPLRKSFIGTVMTEPDHRNKGLAGQLIHHILQDWQQEADAFFLFANPTTVDFYPKFGVTRSEEYQYIMPVSPRAGDFRKLDMDSPDDVALLRHYYEKSNPFSPLRVEHNFGLLMFYCSAFMKHFVYYSAKNEAVVIAMQNGPVLICFDLFCDVGKSLSTLVNELADDQPEGASGLGVQILSAGGALVPLNQVSQVWSGNKGSQTNYRLSYQARYIQTQPAVTAGDANASATFVVTYN